MTWTEAKAEAQRMANEHAEPVFVTVDRKNGKAEYGCVFPTGWSLIQPPIWTAFPE